MWRYRDQINLYCWTYEMTKRKKIAIGTAALLLVVTACTLSWFYGFRQGLRAGGLTASMAEIMHNSELYAEELRNANCEGVEKAIIDHLSMIEKHKDNEGSLITGRGFLIDKMLDHTRLSVIENHLGNQQESEAHLDIALEACKELKWKECTEGKLLQFEQRIDEKNPIACLLDDN